MSKMTFIRALTITVVTSAVGVVTTRVSAQEEAELAPADRANGAGEITVYHAEGKKRVHIEGCGRLTTDPRELAKMTKMTLAEALAKGLPLCSRCPGSTTPGKGNPPKGPESWVNPPPESIEKKPFRPDPRRPLVSLGADGRLVYEPYSDKGDRILDWSNCGYKASEVPIPDVPVVVALSPLAGERQPQGSMAYPVGPDSREPIQAGLDKVAAGKTGPDGVKGAVLLKKGTYYLSGSLQISSGVVLRGEGDGADGTVLIMTVPGGGNGIELGSPDALAVETGEIVQVANDYVPSGSMKLTVADATPFKVGDDIVITKTINQEWIDLLGCGERLRHIRGGKEGEHKRPWTPEAYRFRNYRKVAGIAGNTIALDGMLPQSLAAERGGGTVQKVVLDSTDSHCGVESLRLVSNYDTSARDTSKDASAFKNLSVGVKIKCINGWVRDCTVLHSYFAAVNIGSTARVSRYNTIRDCKSLEQVGPVRGGKRYPYVVAGGSHALFYNCYADVGRHSFSGGSRVQGPNAYVNCTADKDGQSEPHHRWGTGFLYDHITLKESGNITAINRGDSGSGHGWAAANTVIWNAYAHNVVVFDPETEGENNFAIGFRGPQKDQYDTGGVMYANTRAGYWGTPKEGGYFGYALMGSGYIESPDKPVKPTSLFVQQLIDRIGRARAAAVLK